MSKDNVAKHVIVSLNLQSIEEQKGKSMKNYTFPWDQFYIVDSNQSNLSSSSAQAQLINLIYCQVAT